MRRRTRVQFSSDPASWWGRYARAPETRLERSAQRRRASHSTRSLSRQGNSLSLRGETQGALDELIVAQSGCPRGLGKARVVLGTGKDSRKGIHFHHVRHAGSIKSHVDARPIAAAENLVGGEHDLFDPAPQRLVDPRRTLKNLQRVAPIIPEPLGFEAVHRKRARRQSIEVHPDDRQHVRAIAVAHDRAGELTSWEVLLHQYGLRVPLEQKRSLLLRLRDRAAVVVFRDPLRGALVHRLHEQRKTKPSASSLGLARGEAIEHRGDLGGIPNEREGRRRYAVIRQKLFRARLVQAQ